MHGDQRYDDNNTDGAHDHPNSSPAEVILFDYLKDKSRIVSTFALQALADFAEHDAALRDRLPPLVNELGRKGNPAVRARSLGERSSRRPINYAVSLSQVAVPTPRLRNCTRCTFPVAVLGNASQPPLPWERSATGAIATAVPAGFTPPFADFCNKRGQERTTATQASELQPSTSGA